MIIDALHERKNNKRNEMMRKRERERGVNIVIIQS